MFVIGHRGCRGLFPENTIDGFIEAIRLGVQAIELDVVVSADKEIVVSHEPYMSKVTCLLPNGEQIAIEDDQKINLYQLDYSEIKQYDCGLKVNPKFPKQVKLPCYKPLLTETIIACEKYTNQMSLPEIAYVIEVKSKPEWYNKYYPEPKRYVKLLLNELNHFLFKNRIILKSFDVSILNEINRQDNSVVMSLLVNREEYIDDKLKMLNFVPQILGPYYQLLSKELVSNYQQKGFLIYPWTINESIDIERIASYGVDAIITDYPNRISIE